MVVQIDVQMVFVELADGASMLLRNVHASHGLSNHASVLSLHQRVVVAVSRPGFGLSDQEFVQQPCYDLVDVLRSIIGVESKNRKGILFNQIFQ